MMVGFIGFMFLFGLTFASRLLAYAGVLDDFASAYNTLFGASAGSSDMAQFKALARDAKAGEVELLLNRTNEGLVNFIEPGAGVYLTLYDAINEEATSDTASLFELLDVETSAAAAGQVDAFRAWVAGKGAPAYGGDANNDRLADLLKFAVDNY